MGEKDIKINFIPISEEGLSENETRSFLDSIGVDTSMYPSESFSLPEVSSSDSIEIPFQKYHNGAQTQEESDRIDQSYRDAYGEEYPGQWDYLEDDDGRDDDNYF